MSSFSTFRSSDSIFYDNGTSKSASRKIWVCATVSIVFGFAIGILVGRFATCPEEKEIPQPDGTFLPGVPNSIIQDGDPTISEEIINSIKAENIKEYLRSVSLNYHFFLYVQTRIQEKVYRAYASYKMGNILYSMKSRFPQILVLNIPPLT